MAADAEALFFAHHQQLFRYLCRAVGHAESAPHVPPLRRLDRSYLAEIDAGEIEVASGNST